MKTRTNLSRRDFLSTALTASAAAITMPQIMAASRTSRQLIIGEGEHRYEVRHHWAQLPDKYTWQTTHNVALDKAGNLYVIHEGKKELKDHPSIFVFDPQGKFVRAFGQQFQGGGHGIEVRREGNSEFLYVCAYQQVKSFAKLTLTGETVWEHYAPMDSGVYAKDEDKIRVQRWGRDAFMPTNFAFLDDGGFLLTDGYGSFYIHRYDRDGNWVSKFGGPGEGKGTFSTPHGIWIDRRPGREEQIVVCDRAHHTLQYFTMKGDYLETIEGFGLPANVDTLNDLLLVPELHARVSILDKNNHPIARLGADVDRVTKQVKNVRGDSNLWIDGKFIHPHDACFAPNGDILIAEWVSTGRITRLIKVA
ncbi:MAG: hypothetical protein K9N62_20360 [Verrucomicrobia bacterium]|jgi:hypothetical protein|nr:hypothetical protein [Verrucomicrobiota bacterium]